MFKNGGILFHKKSASPQGVDKDSIILFYNDEGQLCFTDDEGYTQVIEIRSTDKPTQENSQEYNEENIPANYDDLMVSTNTFFGDGSDGVQEVNKLFVLDRDYYFKTLKLNRNAIVQTNGFRLFVQETLTFNGGIIQCNGNSATKSETYIVGSMGGSETKIGSLGQGAPGNKGANGKIVDGINTSQNIILPITNGGKGGFGGHGGEGKIGKGGKSVISNNTNKYLVRNVYLALNGARGPHLINGGIGGDGGGSGGGDGVNYGAAGGGGGGGAGVMHIIAKTIIITPYAIYPGIQADGGDASDGCDAQQGDCGGGGGGSGGGGGYILLIYLNLPFEQMNGFISAKGGKMGKGGKGSGTGQNGIDGMIGNAGTIECINIKNGKWAVCTKGLTETKGYK
jgi:hypothetical protein